MTPPKDPVSAPLVPASVASDNCPSRNQTEGDRRERLGTAVDTAARDAAVVASIALQHGCPAETLRHALMRDGNGAASGPLGQFLDLLAAEPVGS